MKLPHQNKMREIKIEKVTLNMGVGSAGDKLNKAKRLLEQIAGTKSIETKTMERIPSWGLRPKLPIGCKITIRGKKAEKLAARLLKALDNKLKKKSFDDFGNISFGIKEYIDIPEIEYNPEFGIIGLEAAVTLERAGFRIKRRIKSGKIPSRHKIMKEDAIEFMKDKFNVTITEEEK
ncbi:50S ribosomal protein L5 [Candidatus Woesearchaeota archaeon]|nr:50S ribosomal protein L5 [Candidatus Woesearchaeota archaeon]